MKGKTISDAVTNISTEYIEKAADYDDTARKKAQKPVWLALVAVAACLCLVAAGLFTIPQIKPKEKVDTIAGGHLLNHTEQMDVKLIEWQGEGFKAVVVDKGTNRFFPNNAKLTVFLVETSEVILQDGTRFSYNADEPNATDIGWTSGEIVSVEFSYYEDYLEGNGFYNRVEAKQVELKSTKKES